MSNKKSGHSFYWRFNHFVHLDVSYLLTRCVQYSQKMNVLAVLSFLASLEAMMEEYTNSQRRWRMILLTLVMAATLIPNLMDLYEFFTSPMSKLLRILDALHDYLYGVSKDKYYDYLCSIGKPMFCNPFTQRSMPCKHYKIMTEEVIEEGKHITFPDSGSLNCRIVVTDREQGVIDRMMQEGFLIYDKDDGVQQFYCKTTKALASLRIEPGMHCKIDYNINLLDSEVVLLYDFFDETLQCTTVKATGFLFSDAFNCSRDDVVHVIKFLEFVKFTGRECCFTVKSVMRFTKSSRLHCHSLKEALALILGKKRFIFTDLPGDKVAEGD